MGEDGERLAMPGPRGPRGERGPAELSRAVRSALVFLYALSVILAGANLFWTAHSVDTSRAAIQGAQHREQVLQQQAGAVLGERLCATFGKLAALKPPPGNPAANPARGYEQEEHATLDQLGTDLGCKGA